MDHLDPHTEAEKPPSYRTAGSSHSEDENLTPPNTPPLQPATNLQSGPIPIVEPQHTPPSAVKPSPNRGTPSKTRLGAIDEHSDAVSPDLPQRSPLRLLGFGHTKLFGLSSSLQSKPQRGTPARLWDDIEGPNGEKFSDVRQNVKKPAGRRGGWKRLALWIGLAILIAGLIVMIVLLAVLLPRRNRNRNSENNNSDSSLSADQSFPAGSYAITSYLTTTETSCTSNSATWYCTPGQTYAQSSSVPPSVLSWDITHNKDGRYYLSATDALNSGYPITNQLLTLQDTNSSEEAWSFALTFQKKTIPSTSLTSENIRSNCYFNNTRLSAKLYTRKPKAEVLNSTTSGRDQWPFALEFEETVTSGDGVPNCYQVENGQDGSKVDVQTGASGGVCECQYMNYGF